MPSNKANLFEANVQIYVLHIYAISISLIAMAGMTTITNDLSIIMLMTQEGIENSNNVISNKYA